MEFRLRHFVTPELGNDEELLWTGYPAPLRVLRKKVVKLAVVSLLTIAAVIVATLTLPALWRTITIFLASLFVLLGAFYYLVIQYRNALRTVYGLTNKRLLIIDTRRNKRVFSYSGTQLKSVKVKEQAEGRGDILITTESEQLKLFGINNARTVASMIVTRLKIARAE